MRITQLRQSVSYCIFWFQGDAGPPLIHFGHASFCIVDWQRDVIMLLANDYDDDD